MESSEKDIKNRKPQAWRALNNLRKIWKSNISNSLKTRIFDVTVETILLYGCEAWTLTTALSKSLDGCYTRMLRAIYNINWQQHVTNDDLYGDLPKVTDKIASRRLRLAGHCLRHPELPASAVVLWEPTHGVMSQGRPIKTMVNTLKGDTGAADVEELRSLMRDRVVWRGCCSVRQKKSKK